jgi:hypothetical protein
LIDDFLTTERAFAVAALVQDSFVVGLASLESRVGLFSFARYDPAFRDKLHDEAEHENDAEAERAKKRKRTKTEAKKKTPRKGKEKAPVEEEEEDESQADTAGQAEANRRLLIARSCKVMAHEVSRPFTRHAWPVSILTPNTVNATPGVPHVQH